MRAVITGINGQDGTLLAAQLIRKGYSVFGVAKPGSNLSKEVNSLAKTVNLDLSSDFVSLEFFNSVKPDLIFHFAAVHASSSEMKNTEIQFGSAMQRCHSGITRNILDWQLRNPASKSIIALSSLMFNRNPAENIVIDENSTPDSTSMYGVTKAEAWNLIKKYRAEFGTLTSGVILFNHASIYSKPEFLFSELASKIANTSISKTSEISVRNPNAFVDITSAEEICSAIYAVAQLDSLQDFVLGSGSSQTISEILNEYSEKNNVQISIENAESGKLEYCLVSSITKARNMLGWEPNVSPAELLAQLVAHRTGGETIE